MADKTLDGGARSLYVLTLPEECLAEPGWRAAFAIPVMSRKEGLISAVPSDYVSPAVLSMGLEAGQELLVGPSKILEDVLAIEEDEQGIEYPSGGVLAICLIDFSRDVLKHLVEHDPEAHGDSALSFQEDAPSTMPASDEMPGVGTGGSLRRQDPVLLGWRGGKLLPYYHDEAQSACKGKGSYVQKVTTAMLSEQILGISDALPALSSQLMQMQQKQRAFEEALSHVQHAQKTPSHRMPFPTGPLAVPKDVPALLSKLSPPPRVRTTPARQGAVAMDEDEPVMLPHDEGFHAMPASSSQGDLGQAMFQQSQALTALVAHLVGEEGIADLGGAGSSGSLSTKGSIKNQEGEAAEGTGQPLRVFLSAGQSERMLSPQAIRPCPSRPEPGRCEISLHSLLGEAGWVCRSEGSRSGNVPGRADHRSVVGWGCERGPGVDCSHHACFGPVCSGWWQMGSCMGPFSARGSSPRHVPTPASTHKSETSGLRSFVPCAMDYNGTGLHQGARLDCKPASRVESASARQQEGRCGERRRKRGAGAKAQAEVPEETKGLKACDAQQRAEHKGVECHQSTGTGGGIPGLGNGGVTPLSCGVDRPRGVGGSAETVGRFLSGTEDEKSLGSGATLCQAACPTRSYLHGPSCKSILTTRGAVG